MLSWLDNFKTKVSSDYKNRLIYSHKDKFRTLDILQNKLADGIDANSWFVYEFMCLNYKFLKAKIDDRFSSFKLICDSSNAISEAENFIKEQLTYMLQGSDNAKNVLFIEKTELIPTENFLEILKFKNNDYQGNSASDYFMLRSTFINQNFGDDCSQYFNFRMVLMTMQLYNIGNWQNFKNEPLLYEDDFVDMFKQHKMNFENELLPIYDKLTDLHWRFDDELIRKKADNLIFSNLGL